MSVLKIIFRRENYMKKIRKFVSALGILAITSPILIGCGSGNDPNENNSKSESEISNSESASSEDIPTVTWYAFGNSTDSLDRINEAGTKMLQEAGINAKLDLRYLTWADGDSKLSTMIASGEEFDLFNKDIATIDNYALNGGAYEISDDDLQNYLPDVVNAMGENIVDRCRFNGKLYAAPVAHEFAQWRGVYYNSNIADQYGIDMSNVDSIDDLDAVFAELKEKAPDIIPLDPINSENILMVMADLDTVNRADSLCLGMDITDENGAVYNPYENEKVVNALKKLREWNQKGYLLTDTTADAISMFVKEGKIFCHIARMKPGTAEQYSVNGQSFKKIVFNNNEAVQTFCDFPGGWGIAISATSDNPKAAMQVLNFAFSSKDFINLLTFGEKDIDYQEDSDGVFAVNNTGYAADDYSNAAWQMGNHYLNNITNVQKEAGLSDIWDQMKEFNDGARSQKHTGFYFDSSNYTSQVTAVANTYNEYSGGLIIGENDVDSTLTQFNDELKANGIDDLVDAANQQYQEFINQ